MFTELYNYLNSVPATKREEIKMWIDTVYAAKVKKSEENYISEIEHIIDWLGSEAAPTRLRKLSYEQAVIGANKWTEQLRKKSGNIIETEEDTEVIKQYKTGAKLVRLKGKSAFLREGNLMSHCVGSYYDKPDTIIYSLRDVNNAPHCTIEVTGKNNQVNQIKGKGNGSVHPKYIKYIIDILTTVFKLPVRDSELENLGYIKLSPDTLKIIDNYMVGAKFIMFNNNKYFYKYSQLKRKTEV